MPERRIETTTSRTAEMTCGCRAASAMETDSMYKSNDWVAPMLLPRKMQLMIRFSPARKLLARVLGPQGIYEWVIARTRYIDSIFSRASSGGFSQFLLFGAGFDTRGVRFQSELKGAQVYELDAPTTQSAKIEQYRRRNISTTPNLVFVPINFEKESVAERLQEAGFRKGARTLVVVEGVFQYLKPEAVYAAMQTISDQVGKGSWLVFDYAHASVLRGDGNAYGEDRMTRGVRKFGESWQFGLEPEEVPPLLARYGFNLIDRKSPSDLEELYFKDGNGMVKSRINGTQSIVMAERT